MPLNNGIILLGGTGSVGESVLKALSEINGKLNGFSFYKNIHKALEIIKKFNPDFVITTDLHSYESIKNNTGKTKAYFGMGAILEKIEATDCTSVVNALTGIIGLLPSIETLKNNKRLIIANKESIVCGGKVLLNAKKYPQQIIPIDSEHWSVFTLLDYTKPEKIKEIILTASGGPFRDFPFERFNEITPSQALAHPVWNMGDIITISSATMANKGLEIIEAKELFNFPLNQINVFVHPEAKVHAMLRLKDGSLLAHISPTSMVDPARNAMLYPEIQFNSDFSLDHQTLNFKPVDMKKFPMLQLAYEACHIGHSHQIIYTVANESAVDFFLKNKIKFTDISLGVESLLQSISPAPIENIDDILQMDALVRNKANEKFHQISLKN